MIHVGKGNREVGEWQKNKIMKARGNENRMTGWEGNRGGAFCERLGGVGQRDGKWDCGRWRGKDGISRWRNV